MDISVISGLQEATGDLLVLPVYKDRAWGPGAEEIAEQLGDWLDAYLDGLDFTGKRGQAAAVPGTGGFGRVLFVGVGDEVDADALRKAAGVAGRAAMRYEKVVTTLAQIEIDGAAEVVTNGFLLGQYKFGKYLSEPKPSKTASLVLVGDASSDDIDHGRIVAEAVAMARDLVNEPASGKKPEVLAGIATDMAAELGIDIKVYDRDEIEAERFGGLFAVALGSTNPPRMVVMNYNPEGATKTLALVGKGIVFDSGGLSIKPASGMETMKTDMSGAASVFGAVRAIASLGVAVNVLAITPLTENMTGGAAQRPGDVFKARNGKTVEVLNTDAEGRLVLADGLSLAAEAKPDLTIDIATLTGACVVALGPSIAGLFPSDDEAAAQVEAAARRAGEKVWRMPVEPDYRSKLDSPIADLKNIGDRYGGAITAALFLEEFT
ncbi:MAG: leucyl aminopeptidase, partial [Acidimicrobiia bacterium]|nr:leucyl aminopeptidase [Acidimicrobiia bacterium]MDX2465914.1 leucyl aminopeptidase [Acidimicrobiia bacterium]